MAITSFGRRRSTLYGKGVAMLPGRGERQMATTRNRTYPSKPITERVSILGAITNPEFIAVVIFCAIGLLVTLNVLLRFPDWGRFSQ
jgi:hypothetical protein